MNQIEKVARAICISDDIDPDEVFEGQPIWHDRIDNAKAAIAAMPIQAEPVAELRAEITRLTEALRLQMEAKHKEAAEAKLWFHKAQEWKEALRAAEEREKGLRGALAFYARENSWKSCGMYMSGRPNPSSAELDAGNKARQALAGAKP